MGLALGSGVLLASLPLPGSAGAILGAWTAGSYVLVALAHATARPRFLGKRPDGRLGIRALAAAPYLGLVRGFHRLKRLRARWALEPWTPAGPGLWIGRFGPEPTPSDADFLVDLTSEFSAPRRWRRHAGYRNLPALNRWIPDPEATGRLLEEIGDRSVAVACGAGKGRSALLVAALMVRRGAADDVAAAIRALASQRPGLALHPVQRRLADALSETNADDPPVAPRPREA